MFNLVGKTLLLLVIAVILSAIGTKNLYAQEASSIFDEGVDTTIRAEDIGDDVRMWAQNTALKLKEVLIDIKKLKPQEKRKELTRVIQESILEAKDTRELLLMRFILNRALKLSELFQDQEDALSINYVLLPGVKKAIDLYERADLPYLTAHQDKPENEITPPPYAGFTKENIGFLLTASNLNKNVQNQFEILKFSMVWIANDLLRSPEAKRNATNARLILKLQQKYEEAKNIAQPPTQITNNALRQLILEAYNTLIVEKISLPKNPPQPPQEKLIFTSVMKSHDTERRRTWLSFSPDGQYVMRTDDHNSTGWSSISAYSLSQENAPLDNKKVIRDVACLTTQFSPNGEFIGVGLGRYIEGYRSVKILKWDDFSEVFSIDSANAYDVIFSPDNHYAAIRTLNEIIIVDLVTKTPYFRFEHDNNDALLKIAFSANSSYLASVSNVHSTISIFDIAQKNKVQTIYSDHQISEILFTPDNRYLIINNSKIQLIDLESQKIFNIPLSHNFNQIVSMALSPDGELLVINNGDWGVEAIDIQSHSIIDKFFSDVVNGFNQMKFSPNGQYLVFLKRSNNSIIIFDLEKKEYKTINFYLNEGSLDNFQFSLDGKYMITAGTYRFGDTHGAYRRMASFSILDVLHDWKTTQVIERETGGFNSNAQFSSTGTYISLSSEKHSEIIYLAHQSEVTHENK